MCVYVCMYVYCTSVMVPVISKDPGIMCIYQYIYIYVLYIHIKYIYILCVYYSVVIVLTDSLRSHRGNLNYFCSLYIIWASVTLNSV